MITGLSHASISVLDQDSAKEFYTGKLGFEVRDDLRAGDFRWLTVGPPGQPDFRLILMRPGPPQQDPETEKLMREPIAKGAVSSGVWQTSRLPQDPRGAFRPRRHFPAGAPRTPLWRRSRVPRRLRQLVQPHRALRRRARPEQRLGLRAPVNSVFPSEKAPDGVLRVA
ncbi:VOC family protein [Amycolatopsis acidicola]|uniref:VOC family protein n=1 Tax=Amycolatopsis acidicola TaxID=2596893 RepID=UPI00312CB670